MSRFGHSLQAATDCYLPLRVTAHEARPAVPKRPLVAALLLCVPLTAGVSLSLSAPGSSPVAGSPARGLSHEQRLLPAGALAPVSAALGQAQGAYHLTSSAGVLYGHNPAQDLHVAFDRDGARVRTRGVQLALSVRAGGYGSTLRPLAQTTPRASANRAVYARAGLTESYVNGPLGVEQSFTLARALPAASGGALGLAMALATNAHPWLAPTRQSLTLRGAGGAALRYGSLVVSDARGRRLPSWLELHGRTLVLRVNTRGARYPVRIDPLIEGATLPPGESASEHARSGYTVALSANGATALVGARAGVGEVWVFTNAGGTWSEQGSPLAIEEEHTSSGEGCEEPAVCDLGRSVALSADGSTALVGGPKDDHGRGAVWVFTRTVMGTETTWAQQGPKLVGGEEEVGRAHFGRSVALSGDGNTALIGAADDDKGEGAAWVFTRTGETWTQQGPKLVGGEEEQGEGHFGRSVALSGDGNTALVGAPDDEVAPGSQAGAAWVFTRSGETWGQQGPKLTSTEESAEAHFGASVALSVFGNTALVGAPDDELEAGMRAGAAWVFKRADEAWAQQGPALRGGGEESGEGAFGASVALSADGEVALVGAPKDDKRVGAAWVFTDSGSTWGQAGEKATGEKPTGRKMPPREQFGASVALSASGALALIGAPDANRRAGAAWAFVDSSAPPPTVSTITPSSGPSEGGTPVTITGSGFLPGATVEISAPGSVEVVSETELKALTTAHEAGGQEVVVSDEAGKSTGGPTYTYVAPEPSPTTTTTTGSSSGNGGQVSTNAQVNVLSNVAVSAPQLGVTGNLTPVSGKVYVKLPGANKFVLLTGITQVPFGTIVNALHGKVVVTTTARDGRLQSMTFYAGEFKLTQSRSGMVVATLYGGNFSVCPTKRERSHVAALTSTTHASGKHVVRKLWAEGHGNYSTKGNYASGAVLGTRWLTEDRCEGTLIYVSTDSVAVTNLVTHRHKTVKAGHGYLAKAP